MASRQCCGVCLSLLVVALALGQASAAWYSSMAIANVGSGGRVMFATAGPKDAFLYLYRGLNPQPVGGSTIPKPEQSFSASAGYPNKAFTLSVKGKFLVASAGGAITLSAKAADATSWTLDTYYRLASSGRCLDTANKVFEKTKLVIKPCSKSPTQQWNFLPAENPPKGVVNGLFQALDLNLPYDTCISEGPQADPSVPGVFSVIPFACGLLTPAAQQLSTSGKLTNDQNWNTGVFQLVFEGQKRCLFVLCPGCADGAPKESATLVSADCANEFKDGYYYRWYYNSRGQLQSDAVAGENLQPVCIQLVDGNLVAGDCSLKNFNNRWGVSAPSW